VLLCVKLWQIKYGSLLHIPSRTPYLITRTHTLSHHTHAVTCAHAHTLACIRTRTGTHASTHKCILNAVSRSHSRTSSCTRIRTYTRVRLHLHIYIHIHVCTHTHTHTHVCTHTHTHTYTHAIFLILAAKVLQGQQIECLVLPCAAILLNLITLWIVAIKWSLSAPVTPIS
jgi:hypothetical protein